MQLDLLEVSSTPGKNETSFIDNMKLPVHRWFRYSAGFSAGWVVEEIRKLPVPPKCVLDPFAGSGTTMLAADECQVRSIGTDAHPFVVRIARAKQKWGSDDKQFTEIATDIVSTASEIYQKHPPDISEMPELLQKAYSPEALMKLDSLRLAWQALPSKLDATELCWLAITAILRITSSVGTAPWQYVLPKKQKAKTIDPFDAFRYQTRMMLQDMRHMKKFGDHALSKMYATDARTLSDVPEDTIDFVITSPPYANNYDYADATRLEMTFWREVAGWGDLQQAVRKELIRSCTQHASAEKLDLNELLDDPSLRPILSELSPVCKELEEERHLHGGKKPYHLMVAAYFADMAKVWHALSRVCVPDARLCFVIGDSAPYGIYLPVASWYTKLAWAAGFENVAYYKTRDRNVKWANRTHSEILTEGQLWVNHIMSNNAHTVERVGSATHKLGQLVGNFFEEMAYDSLNELAERNAMYCDRKGSRAPVRGNRKKLTWSDTRGTPHDLDYVIERNASVETQGTPAAFIELAWRRYTKHSRNKAGEIEAALYHLGNSYPGAFLGAILAGEWSEGSLDQMRVRGIHVLHIPFEDVAATFDSVDIDLRYGEKSSDSIKWDLIDKWSNLSTAQIIGLQTELRRRIEDKLNQFLNDLENATTSEVLSVRILPLYGQTLIYLTIEEAVSAVEAEDFGASSATAEFIRYEVQILLANGGDVNGKFESRQALLDFLSKFH